MEKIGDVLHIGGHNEKEDGKKHHDKETESRKEAEKHHPDDKHAGEGLIKIQGEGGDHHGGDHKKGLVEEIKDKIHGDGGEHHGSKDDKKKKKKKKKERKSDGHDDDESSSSGSDSD